MESIIKDIAAMRFDFPVTDEELEVMAAEVAAIPDEHWYWCTFRESYLICLYGNANVDNKREMSWLPFALNCPKLIELCEKFVFPMTDIKPRIIIIRTMKDMKMTHHTDCFVDQFSKLEPKLRVVLKGRVGNTLFFIKEDGSEVHISDEWRGYIMSGAVLHGMNNTSGDKLTLCFGDPWTGDNLENEEFVRYFELQHNLYSDTKITVSSMGNVDHSSGVKDPKVEKMYAWNDWNKSKAD